jgi:peptidoglycan/xylan/chitin deacetylase (PgdA/CDA1 family)
LTNPHYKGVLKRLGMQMIGWDVRSMDTRWETDDVIAGVLRQARDGSIILLHDGGSSADRIQQIVTPIISELRRKGFVFCRLDELVG